MQYEKMEFLEGRGGSGAARGAGIAERGASAARSRQPADLHDVMSLAARFFEQNLADNARARGLRGGSRDRCRDRNPPLPWDTRPMHGTPCSSGLAAHDDERRRLLQVGLVVERSPGGERADGGERSNSAARAAGFYDRFRDRLMFRFATSRGRVIGFGGRVIDQGDRNI